MFFYPDHLHPHPHRYSLRSQQEEDIHFYRKAALKALKQELRCRRMIKIRSNPTKLQHRICKFFIKAAERARKEALENFLTIYCINRGMDLHDHRPIPNEDRVALYQAISCKTPFKFIQVMLDDYPRACESGGCVDHINHPIHAACIYHQEVVEYILLMNPDSKTQPNEEGQMPLELFHENKEQIGVSHNDFFPSSANWGILMYSTTSQKILSRRQKDTKLKVTVDYIMPCKDSESTTSDLTW